MKSGMMIAATTLALAVAGCHDKIDTANNATAEAARQPSLRQALDGANGLGQTARLVKQAGLDRMFDGDASYVLFAPTDAAIEALPAETRQKLASPAGRPQLLALLRQHIAPGFISRADIDRALARKDGQVRLATMGSAPLTLRRQGDAIVIGSDTPTPRLTQQPIVARNGTIFPIDHVLPPSKAR
ncbi:fasciclin domain-containing protein [Sphingomonas fuzhouensis]|uniref:fasciclin domain-containing protein n=1 Tax=Sphingomonas fuzhouensis TaxID=3106033 RepID=UPI002AFDCB83|nr:fasciclin domain-containing protein [Sphingomonas sp. SGZ-02]